MKLHFMRQSVTERRQMILSGNPLKTLLFLSIPTLLMAVVQSLIPLADGLFLNRSSEVEVAAAVGFAVPIINTLIALSQGLSVAVMSILGQIFGQGDFAKVRHVASQTMFYSFLLGVCIAPFTILSAYGLSFYFEPTVGEHIFRYLSLYSLVLPFLFCASIFNAIKTATGQPEANFFRLVFLFVFKLIFNSLFLTWLQLDEVGAVLASFCSYLLISIWMIYDLYFIPSETQLSFRHIRPDWTYLSSLFRLGLPSILSSTMISIGFVLINAEAASFGKEALNALTIAANINAIAFTLPSAIGTTVTSMVSIYVGTENPKGAKKIFFLGCLLSLCLSALLILFFAPFSKDMVQLFRHEPEIVAIAERSLNLLTWSIMGFGLFMVCNGALIGLGRMKMTLLAGFLRIWLFRYLFILATESFLGVDSISWGNLFSNVLSALIFFVLLLFLPWKSVISKQLAKM